MKILALDPAAKCGWAMNVPGQMKPVSGVEEFEAKDVFCRIQHFENWLRATLVTNDIDVLAYEKWFHNIMPTSNIHTELFLANLYGTAGRLCSVMGLRLIFDEVPTQTWKKAYTGLAQAPKEIGADIKDSKRRSAMRRKWMKQKVIDTCQERGLSPKNDNEADALGVLHWARVKHEPDYSIGTLPLIEASQ